MPSVTPHDTTTGAEDIKTTEIEVPITNGTNGINGTNGTGRKLNGSATWHAGAREPTSSASASNCSADSFNHNTTYGPNSGDPWNRPMPVPPFGDHEEEAGGPRSRAYARIGTYGDDPKSSKFPRLSNPLELMRPSYDCVVIGSGYGGGVAASRMARAGQSVCLLERGKERWPGEYPAESTDALEQVHYSGEFAPSWAPKKIVGGGDPTGMYHMIFGNGQNAVVCNGEPPHTQVKFCLY